MPQKAESEAESPRSGPAPSAPRAPLSVAAVARQFERRAARIGAHDALLREVGERLIERLQYIRLAPGDVLDVGCGLGRTRASLLGRFPQARWTGIDVAAALVTAGRAEQRRAQGLLSLLGRWRNAPRWIVADGGRLPLADHTFDLVFSNLMLHWYPEPHRVFPEWKRVLRTDGLVLFSCFGPDTLRELRAAAAASLPQAAPMPFVDMHDFGDMLVASGFALPVMDVEVLTLTFPGPRELLAEVRALGANPRADRAPALPSGRQARRLLDALAAQRDREGRIALTFEIAYGHAWKPPSREQGTHTIAVDALREQLARRRQ
jgi:malonyl-CoA O-methyltransferase